MNVFRFLQIRKGCIFRAYIGDIASLSLPEFLGNKHGCEAWLGQERVGLEVIADRVVTK